MKVRLFKSGSIVGEVAGSTGTEKQLDRRAMFVYAGKFDSMDGEVEVTKEHIETLAKNHNDVHTKLSAGPSGVLPKDCPPVQVDHSTSGWDTVGRVQGPLEVGDHEGNAALFGTIRFLGSDAVERVSDGRWTHLSLGADLEAGKMNEMTVTPFPAAPNASLLSRLSGWRDPSFDWDGKGRKGAVEYVWGEGSKGKGFAIWDGSDWNIFPTVEEAIAYADTKKLSGIPSNKKFSKGDSMDPKHEAMKKHLMEKEKLSEKDADEKLSKMNDEDKEKLSASLTAEEPPKEEPKEEPKDKKLAKGTKAKFTELTKGFRTSVAELSAGNKKVQLAGRIAKLRSEGKVSPSEQKEMDLDKLAKLSSPDLDIVFEMYSKRQPIILAGSLGRTDAEDLKVVAKNAADKKMMGEMVESMHFSKGIVKKLSGMPTSMEDKALQLSDPAAGQSMPTSMDDMHAQLSHLKGLLESGNHDEAKVHLEGMITAHGEPAAGGNPSHAGMPEAQAKHLSTLAESVEKLQTQFEELVQLTSPLLTDEDEE